MSTSSMKDLTRSFSIRLRRCALRKPIPIEHGAATVGGDNRLLHSIEQACLEPDFLLGGSPMDLRLFSSVARFIQQLSPPCVLGLKLSFALGFSKLAGLRRL